MNFDYRICKISNFKLKQSCFLRVDVSVHVRLKRLMTFRVRDSEQRRFHRRTLTSRSLRLKKQVFSRSIEAFLNLIVVKERADAGVSVHFRGAPAQRSF